MKLEELSTQTLLRQNRAAEGKERELGINEEEQPPHLLGSKRYIFFSDLKVLELDCVLSHWMHFE